MKSADRVPIKIARFLRLDPLGCPDPRFDRFVISSQLHAFRQRFRAQETGAA